MHPQEHKVKTINYILTPAVKCWHSVLKKKKGSKICFLKPRKRGKAILPGPSSSRSSCCGFWPRQASSTEREAAANSNTVCFRTQEHTACKATASAGWSRRRGRKEGNSRVGATVNWFSLSYQQVGTREHRRPPRAPQLQSVPAVIQNLLFPSPPARRFFRKRKGGKKKKAPGQRKHILLRWDSRGQGGSGSHGVMRNVQISVQQATTFSVSRQRSGSVHCSLVNRRHKAVPKQTALLQGFCCSRDPPGCLCNPSCLEVSQGAPAEPRILQDEKTTQVSKKQKVYCTVTFLSGFE